MARGSGRLFAIVAREQRRAVVFRRGPSSQVLLLSWDLERDVLTPGQWLKGRIYEKRCDLSPSGDLLVYFAAKHKGPMPCWTAVSRPPWLSALALWPKDSAWGGGGLFAKENRLLLNHGAHEQALAEGMRLPKRLKVEPLGARAGRGEDLPILEQRLLRDGWTAVELDVRPSVFTFERRQPKGSARLRMSLSPGSETLWEATFELLDVEAPFLEVFDWADFDHNGDLLVAREGRLYRCEAKRLALENAKAIADLRGLTFEARAAPDAASRW